MREGQILRQIRCILEVKNHQLKWEKWNKEFIERLKRIKFQEEIFNRKFGQLIKEYEYVREQIAAMDPAIMMGTGYLQVGRYQVSGYSDCASSLSAPISTLSLVED